MTDPTLPPMGSDRFLELLRNLAAVSRYDRAEAQEILGGIPVGNKVRLTLCILENRAHRRIEDRIVCAKEFSSLMAVSFLDFYGELSSDKQVNFVERVFACVNASATSSKMLHNPLVSSLADILRKLIHARPTLNYAGEAVVRFLRFATWDVDHYQHLIGWSVLGKVPELIELCFIFPSVINVLQRDLCAKDYGVAIAAAGCLLAAVNHPPLQLLLQPHLKDLLPRLLCTIKEAGAAGVGPHLLLGLAVLTKHHSDVLAGQEKELLDVALVTAGNRDADAHFRLLGVKLVVEVSTTLTTKDMKLSLQNSLHNKMISEWVHLIAQELEVETTSIGKQSQGPAICGSDLFEGMAKACNSFNPPPGSVQSYGWRLQGIAKLNDMAVQADSHLTRGIAIVVVESNPHSAEFFVCLLMRRILGAAEFHCADHASLWTYAYAERVFWVSPDMSERRAAVMRGVFRANSSELVPFERLLQLEDPRMRVCAYRALGKLAKDFYRIPAMEVSAAEALRWFLTCVEEELRLSLSTGSTAALEGLLVAFSGIHPELTADRCHRPFLSSLMTVGGLIRNVPHSAEHHPSAITYSAEGLCHRIARQDLWSVCIEAVRCLILGVYVSERLCEEGWEQVIAALHALQPVENLARSRDEHIRCSMAVLGMWEFLLCRFFPRPGMDVRGIVPTAADSLIGIASMPLYVEVVEAGALEIAGAKMLTQGATNRYYAESWFNQIQSPERRETWKYISIGNRRYVRFSLAAFYVKWRALACLWDFLLRYPNDVFSQLEDIARLVLKVVMEECSQRTHYLCCDSKEPLILDVIPSMAARMLLRILSIASRTGDQELRKTWDMLEPALLRSISHHPRSIIETLLRVFNDCLELLPDGKEYSERLLPHTKSIVMDSLVHAQSQQGILNLSLDEKSDDGIRRIGPFILEKIEKAADGVARLLWIAVEKFGLDPSDPFLDEVTQKADELTALTASRESNLFGLAILFAKLELNLNVESCGMNSKEWIWNRSLAILISGVYEKRHKEHRCWDYPDDTVESSAVRCLQFLISSLANNTKLLEEGMRQLKEAVTKNACENKDSYRFGWAMVAGLLIVEKLPPVASIDLTSKLVSCFIWYLRDDQLSHLFAYEKLTGLAESGHPAVSSQSHEQLREFASAKEKSLDDRIRAATGVTHPYPQN